MTPLLLMLLMPSQCGPMGCRPVATPRHAAPLTLYAPPVFIPAPQPIAPDDDALERARAAGRAEGRVQAREEMRAARKAAGCPPGCLCGCAEGLPCNCKAVFGSDLPTGVDAGKLSATPRYTRNGKECSRAEAVLSVQQVVDDSMRPRLTIIGPEAERRALRKAILADPAVAALVLTQDYPPESPFVSRHDKSGLTVHLQKSTHDGSALMPPVKDSSAADAPGLLARIKAALGLSPPPPPPKPVPPPVIGPDGRPVPPSPPADQSFLAWLMAGLAGLYVLLRETLAPKKEESTK